MPFTEEDDPVECICTLQFTHLIKQVEKDKWLSLIIRHPEGLYGEKKPLEEEAETIANQKFQTSPFQEEDARIFMRVLENYHKFFCLFHGSITKVGEERGEEVLAKVMGDFTVNFEKYFFAADYAQNLMWSLCFQGFFYCPIDRKTFLQAQYLQNGIFMEFEDQVKHVSIFHEEFFVSSTLSNANASSLY
mmetsp:Transcript_4718/g.8059  ORF Transcript_4718/g.8059 Transcript_4718/m.8059 type:complete len:190 (+) Transcript_4718:220-789(+)